MFGEASIVEAGRCLRIIGMGLLMLVSPMIGVGIDGV
jgi:hypothetical protein